MEQEEIRENPKKEESPLVLPPPQQVQGESNQDLPKDWKFVINHPQYQIIEFSKCMHSEFEMSMMGELNFFLGLQIKQLKEGIFINQTKYIRDLLKRFNMEKAKIMKTPMSSSIKLDKDEKVCTFYLRTTYGLGGPIISIVRSVEIQLDPKSIYRIFDIVLVGLRVYESKAWPTMSGFEPREVIQRIHQDEVSYLKAFLVDFILTGRRIHVGYLMMMHMISCYESTTRILPYGHFLTRIGSLSTRMEELAVVSDTRFYSMEDCMDQYQTGFTSQFEYLQQRLERMEDHMDQQQVAFEHLQQMIEHIESRQESHHEEMIAYLRSMFPPPSPQP
ncbi:hypothetical protein CK203_104087 [Vitis vinifera]|uniref:Reverse transcriptase Ty1/copia-type domain-containing protein n=1 Tax=Vitis vinifera TaxID=29760 RepID=A0A438ER11_VITVI|nr:hypothetical protein CK203_104087 [Vitis vinifera]